jgi:hypothetical protein
MVALIPDRRFLPPWSVDEANAACFVVKDGDGKRQAARPVAARAIRRLAGSEVVEPTPT